MCHLNPIIAVRLVLDCLDFVRPRRLLETHAFTVIVQIVPSVRQFDLVRECCYVPSGLWSRFTILFRY